MIEENIALLDDSIKSIVEKILDPMIEQYEPLGILLVGSYANGIPGEHSDLDIYIITEDQDWRERGNYIVDDREIEYFINPVKQVRAYLRNEKTPQKHTAHMFSTGIILYQSDPVVEELIREAKEVVKDHPKLEKKELELLKYSLDDFRKDLTDARPTMNSLEYQLTAARTINQIIHAFYRHYQLNMVKPRLMMQHITNIDPEFAALLEAVIQSHYEFDTFIKLLHYTENLLGGSRDLVWKFPGELDL